MAKVKSPLKAVRTELDLSRSELASFAFPRQEDHVEKTQLSQALARCEAGLLHPEKDGALKYMFDLLAEQGYKNLKKDQESWISELRAKLVGK